MLKNGMTRIEATKMYCMAEGITSDEIEGELILYHPDGSMFILNETGKLVLDEVIAHGNESAAAAMLAARYDIPLNQAIEHVEECVEALVRKGLVAQPSLQVL